MSYPIIVIHPSKSKTNPFLPQFVDDIQTNPKTVAESVFVEALNVYHSGDFIWGYTADEKPISAADITAFNHTMQPAGQSVDYRVVRRTRMENAMGRIKPPFLDFLMNRYPGGLVTANRPKPADLPKGSVSYILVDDIGRPLDVVIFKVIDPLITNNGYATLNVNPVIDTAGQPFLKGYVKDIDFDTMDKLLIEDCFDVEMAHLKRECERVQTIRENLSRDARPDTRDWIPNGGRGRFSRQMPEFKQPPKDEIIELVLDKGYSEFAIIKADGQRISVEDRFGTRDATPALGGYIRKYLRSLPGDTYVELMWRS